MSNALLNKIDDFMLSFSPSQKVDIIKAKAMLEECIKDNTKLHFELERYSKANVILENENERLKQKIKNLSKN